MSAGPRLNSKIVNELINDGISEEEICEILGIIDEELNTAINADNDGTDYIY